MLTDSQKQQVSAWVSEGLSLAQIQEKIAEIFEITMTYMDVRFLIDDLNLELQDSAPEEKTEQEEDKEKNVTSEKKQDVEKNETETAPDEAGSVSLSVDPVQIPGVIASGDVTFSDGTSGKWLIDQSGRPGLAEFPEGYRPPQTDVPIFQQKLVAELRKLGLA